MKVYLELGQHHPDGHKVKRVVVYDQNFGNTKTRIQLLENVLDFLVWFQVKIIHLFLLLWRQYLLV